MPTVKSVRELTDELINIRVGAVDTTIWSIKSTLKDRAQLALKDAIRTFPYKTEAVLSSVYVPGGGVKIALPVETERVVSVVAIDASTGASVTIDKYEFSPSSITTMLEVHNGSVGTTPKWISIRYEMHVADIPNIAYIATDARLVPGAAPIGPVGNTVYLPLQEGTAGVLPTLNMGTVLDQIPYWPSQGFAELHQNTFCYSNSVYVGPSSEIVHYNSITSYPPVGQNVMLLNVDGRSLFGTRAGPWRVGLQKDTIVVSMAIVADGDYFSTIMAQAEANMYNFWLGHRAMYDQYSTLTGQQMLSIEELLTMIRTLEARAERRRDMHREAAKPGRIQFKKRTDI
jgi:hypothetical protein